jgi:hypothetical protein
MPRKTEVEEPRETEQRAKPERPLRARPLKGEVDHAALTRKIIARFPKILAALAK